ncbi:hypothetical protein HPB50_025396 [Hyalomma asiaticum]|uniref:Uncharacterized protein n=1 Tax=Hyalomma asiaticum TaxID=266040 RepID=A0ACB7S3Q7_HYAAI|nr:hypothetical protein HPB50_025396 [Hyalomma asiaticum]
MAVKDEMLPVKLAFMLSVSEELEAFLAEFQTEKPMLPLLATALDGGLLRSLLGRVVLKGKLDAAGRVSELMKIDVENPNNFIGMAALDIGLAAKTGGVAEVDVTDKMIDMVPSATWQEDLERKKKERLDVSDAERKKKRTAALVKELESKKQKLMEDAQLQVSMLQQEI